jgi:enoyl-CoA hydratase/carnithine racemase
MIGTSRALDLLWSSVRIDAQEAYRIGFADRLFAPDALLDETIAYIDRLAENVSRRSLATIKSEVYRHLSMPLAEAAWDADAIMQKALAHADAQEGVASFVERRPPRFARWTGDTDG